MGLRVERECDVLVIGGGAAALVAALEARKAVDNVVVVCKRRAGRSGNTIVAGAVFSVCIPSEGIADSAQQHLRDTMEGGGGINDPLLARALVEGAEAVLRLEQYGVTLLRAQGDLVRRTPPGHSRPRSISTDPHGFTHATRGLSITLPLLKCALERGITVQSDIPVQRLLVRDGVVRGALALDAPSGSQVVWRASAVVLAAGGGGQLFSRTNNSVDMTGDSYALAVEAGAALRDMEFIQFYPSRMTSPAHANVSSPLFREGAVLRNRHGERFMPRYDENADMATRDIMSRAIFREVQAGDGVDGGAYMDLSAVPLPTLERKFPTVLELLRTHGIDPATRWVVVSPVSHFVMGGAWIDQQCRTTVPGLFAAGEAAGGVHGANRIGGNALTETVVFGAKAGREAASFARRMGRPAEAATVAFETPRMRPGSVSVAEVKAQLRRAMWEHASLIRTSTGLRKARAALLECLGALPECRVERSTDLLAYLEVERMAQVGLSIVAAAMERKESRGAHFRDDYPERDDSHWGGSIHLEKVGDSLKTCFVPM